jgi:hypothetical protein
LATATSANALRPRTVRKLDCGSSKLCITFGSFEISDLALRRFIDELIEAGFSVIELANIVGLSPPEIRA